MSLLTKKISENKLKIDRLQDIIPNIDFKIGSETLKIDLIKKRLKNKTIFTVNHEEFPEEYNVIRLYLPLMGDGGYVPDEKEIIQLFQSKDIVPPQNAFINKSSKKYSLKKVGFKPLSENIYNKKIVYYGEIVPYFPN